MGPIEEGIFALLCAVGAFCLVGLFFGWLVRPMNVGALWIILPCQGSGRELEGTLRWLSWLRRAGLFQGEAVLWDVGLTAEGQELALRLTLRFPWAVCCPGGVLEERLREHSEP